LERLDRTAIDGEFSARRLRVFIPRRGGQLEKDQREWEEQHNEEEEPEEEESRGDMVWTLLFVGGEHGMGDGGPEGKKEAKAADAV
jgi:hypothetical protein